MLIINLYETYATNLLRICDELQRKVRKGQDGKYVLIKNWNRYNRAISMARLYPNSEHCTKI